MPREREDSPWRGGEVKQRKVRGPDDEGRFYWRGESKTEGHVWSGWGKREDPETTREVQAALEEKRGAPPPEVVGELPGNTMRALFGVWKAAMKLRADSGDLAASSYAGYCVSLRHLDRHLGDVLIANVRTATLDSYKSARRREPPKARRPRVGAAPATIARELYVLAAIWSWGRERGYTPDRDIGTMPTVKVTPVRNMHTPTEEDVLAVIEQARHPWVRLALSLLLATGARLHSIHDLTWRDVDFDQATVSLPDTKTGRRVVPIGADVMRELRPFVAGPDERVLGVDPGHVRGRLQAEMLISAQAAGVEPFSPHGLRRLACDLLYIEGTDVGVAASFLGHSAVVALRHYRRPKLQQLRSAIDRVGLGRIPEGKVLPIGKSKKGE
jgi:integrase